MTSLLLMFKRCGQILRFNPALLEQPHVPNQVPAVAPSLLPSGCVCFAPNYGWFQVTRQCATKALDALTLSADECDVRTWLGLAWRRYRRWLVGLPARIDFRKMFVECIHATK